MTLIVPSDPKTLDTARLRAEAQDLMPAVISLRRAIHREPELGLDLPKTQAKVLDALAGLDLTIETGKALTSVVATLDGGEDGPTILLRGDMDALPMPENSGEAFASETEGRMHACGHDTHVAMLAGAARLLHARRSELKGRIKFFFQPGEEGYHGAKYAIEEGLLDNVDAGFAIHISPNLESGAMQTKPGPLLAAADTVTITISGQGGHASAPHHAIDVMPAACEVVTTLQTRLTRTVDVFDPAVLTITAINGGTTNNVIPESVTMMGTLRTFSDKTREHMRSVIVQVAEGIAAVHGCTAAVELSAGYPVTVNDDEFVAWATPILRDVVGEENVRALKAPIMAAEDWSYVLNEIPGAMVFLGVCPPGEDPRHAHACHSNHMRVDEDAMVNGIAAHAAIAMSFLG